VKDLQSNNFYCKTIESNHSEIPKLINWITGLVDSNLIGKRKENYTIDNLKLDQQIAFTYVKDITTDKFIAFSSIHKSKFYPSGVVRVLNRNLLVVEYRHLVKGKKQILNILSQMMLHTQSEFIKESSTISHIFVSQEQPHERRMRVQAKMASNVILPILNQEFKFIDNPILVCNNPTNRSCWQHVYFSKLDTQPDSIDVTKFFTTCYSPTTN